MIYYVTGNSDKFDSAKKYFDVSELELEQLDLKIKESQSDSVEEVAVEKAEQAFEQVRKPVFVNDSGWIIPALKGFPGPYMKYINEWFAPEDFIALLQRHADKSVILRQSIVYKDENQLKVFNFDIEGKILDTIRGENGRSSDKVITLTEDGKTIAEHKDEGSVNDNSEAKIWDEFISFLKESRK